MPSSSSDMHDMHPPRRHSKGFLTLVDTARAHVHEVTVDETRERLTSNLQLALIDIREDHEWEAGHIAGAVHIGKGVIERDIEDAVPDKGTEIILYCGGGYRSILAADALQQMGYTNVSSMAGGWRAWRATGGATA